MMDKQLHNFCGSIFWDEYQTWNTTDPDFSVCFHETILVWVPCAFLWILTPIEIIYLVRQKFQHIPWSPLIFFKLILTTALIVICILQLGHKVVVIQPFPADYWAAGIKLITYILSVILVIAAKKQGLNSSGVLFLFWFLSAICGAITYRSHFSGTLAEDPRTDYFLYVTNLIVFPLVAAQLIAAFFPDTIISPETKQKECPFKKASFPSVALFAWFDPLLWRGFRKGLTEKDLWDLDEEYRSAYVHTQTEEYTQKWKEKHPQSKKPPTFSRLLWELNKFEFSMAFVLKLFGDISSFANPLILRLLIDFVSNPVEPNWKGYMYTAAMLVAAILTSMANHNYFFRLQSIGISARASVISTIYRKSLRMSTAAKRTSTSGEIVNLMSVDAQRVMDVWPFVGYLFTTPLTIALAIYLLWQLMGPAVLAGLAVITFVIPFNLFLARIISRYQTQLMKQKDQRIKIVNEILGGIKILKLYAWEISFNQQIARIRAKELKLLRKILYLEATTNFLFQFSPFLISLSTFATYVLSDERNVLDAAKAFVSLSLFDLIRMPLALIPLILSYMIQAMISLRRLDKFMANDELDQLQVKEDLTEKKSILIENGTFTWALDDAPTLRNIKLQCDIGSLVAVVGTVGAGKSSLIAAILGEMEKLSGKIVRNGRVAYVSQQAWVQNASLMDNILFGRPKDEIKYNKVLEFCCLKPDLEVLPGGDQTEIGEKGINLSGGQKQRVALARAVYAEADIYFLDDPLSAVDAHVGKQIFEKVIGPKGLLKGKTRILVTHGISFLPYVDSIVVLTNGTISESGSYKDLLDKAGAFAEFLMTYLKEQGEIDDIEAAELLEIQEGLLSNIENQEIKKKLSRRISRALSSDEEASSERRPSIHGTRRKSSISKEDRKSSANLAVAQNANVLIQKELMESGSVGWRVYLYYFRSCGLWVCIFALCMFSLAWTSSVGSNVWLSFWSNDGPKPDGSQDIALRDLRLGVYAALGMGQVFCSFVAAIALLRSTVRASGFLHRYMATSILHAPMSFFDTTPLGRILNRFSRDVDVLDVTIPMFLRPLIDCLLQIIGIITVICISTPIFLVALLPLSVLYYFIQHIFIESSRQLKRLESVSRSPIFSHFSETLSGLTTIRAYKVQRRFIRISDIKVDTNNTLIYPLLVAKRWLAIRLELVGSLVVFCAALFAVMGRNTLAPGTVGLSVSYALSVTLILTMLVRNWTEVESNSVSIERLKEYTEVKQEAPWEIPENKPKSDWPDKGNVQFDDYCTRYREGLDNVLKGISCDIQSGEKIGIVGRTGAGKSSLTLALFRIIEASRGSITIDGVDISTLGLHDLRTRLTIIPQDPVLFCGTVRMNLDPFDTHSTHEIWKALENSHLKDFVSSLPAGLDHEISEGGENLSVGQRQLLCLARALLRKTKILILDEATAAVDLETDDFIQATIRSEFKDCTVITIAHRINTILDNTRVMVLENGVIIEFADPKELLSNENSVFHSMAKDAGLV